MTILEKVCITLYVIILACSIVVMLKNNNTFKNHKIIIDAIYRYHMAHIKSTLNGPWEVDYTDMEPYDKTKFRMFDWGYKHILPWRKYMIIKPYIEPQPKKRNRFLNFLKSKTFIILISTLILCLVLFVTSVCGYFIVKNLVKEKAVAAQIQAKTVLTEIKDVEPEPEPQPTIEDIYADSIPYIAKTVWGEARGCSKDQMAAVIWTILNRVEDNRWPNSIIGVITQPSQFHGYNSDWPVTDDIYNLTVDVLTRWEKEKAGETNVGRILPKGYLYFHGANGINHFRTSNGKIWDWSLDSPYK